LVVIDIGIDESARKGHRLLTVSAVVGQQARMRILHKKWKTDLKRAGVDYFHATEHWNLQSKPYNGVSMKVREELLLTLAACLNKYIYSAVSVTIDTDEYKQMTSDRFRSQFGSPYTMAVQLLTILIHKELVRKQRSAEDVGFMLEEGKHIYQALAIIDKSIKEPYAFLRVVTSGKGDKASHPILQAADLVSYGWGEYQVTGQSKMLRAVAAKHPKRYSCVPWTPALIACLKSGVAEDITRRREFGAPPLARGLKPLLKLPDGVGGRI